MIVVAPDTKPCLASLANRTPPFPARAARDAKRTAGVDELR